MNNKMIMFLTRKRIDNIYKIIVVISIFHSPKYELEYLRIYPLSGGGHSKSTVSLLI